jgi:ribonuclease P protein component
MAVRSAPNEVGISRFAYSISKRVGKAVVRNKVRRRLREIVRAEPFLEGYDVVIVARPPAAHSDFAALKAELTLLMKRARLLESTPPRPGQGPDA